MSYTCTDETRLKKLSRRTCTNEAYYPWKVFHQVRALENVSSCQPQFPSVPEHLHSAAPAIHIDMDHDLNLHVAATNTGWGSIVVLDPHHLRGDLLWLTVTNDLCNIISEQWNAQGAARAL
eukprot:977389-Amphidinium_carterae.1